MPNWIYKKIDQKLTILLECLHGQFSIIFDHAGIDADQELNQKLANHFNVAPPFGLEDFTYKSSTLLEVISGYLSNTSFDGITVSYASFIKSL